MDLKSLEQEIFGAFQFYYQCDLDIEIEHPLFEDLKNTIMLRMQNNDFQLCERVVVYSFSVPFKPDQIFALFTQIIQLKQEMSCLKLAQFKKRYSAILKEFIAVLGEDVDSIQDVAIKRQVKAICAVTARYEKKLYPRREILYRVLREQLAVRGRKWNNLNQAVILIIPILIKEYEKYDIEWVKTQIALKQAELKKLEQSDAPLTPPSSDYGIKRRRVSPASKAKKINKIQDELKELDSILHSKNPSVMLRELDYDMPYNNTDYLEETIIHELRTQPEILKEILFK